MTSHRNLIKQTPPFAIPLDQRSIHIPHLYIFSR